ncbi:Cytochrome c-type bioproteinis protein CcmE [Alteripontixanthobacter maritimus]|uniref:Cytochrome c-type biogenesis protein CcmE n=1 Tax=Alteripontixanthobacter maritimus TaxID=2161824 RepID=A0A369QAR3_9SPHN|nr:cytochrome c maturation protein CcmE [Alteripontixanthobacter maritimus]RDC60327.1 Cytochrome c-type bioproteinis protein CcmE [Alteripontixanthobacter maritimus]
MSTLQPKHQRLVLGGLAAVLLIVAALVAAWALRSEASYFYLPGQMLSDPPEPGRNVRLGGMVREGSLDTEADGVTVTFLVDDGADATGQAVPVRYAGILPDLFVEGSGVVADGRLAADGTFVAETLLAKHDENYVPRELEEMTAAQARAVVADTETAPAQSANVP